MIEQHTLTYPGKVDPRPGVAMGPSLDHKVWVVLGSTYDPEANTTAVTVEEWQG